MSKRYMDDEKCMIALGRVPKASSLHKFGARTGIQTTPVTIWDDGLTTYPWSAFATAQQLTVVGASDAGKSITILGLDADYNAIEETVVVGSSTVRSFIRVYRAFVVGTVSNIGVLTVRTGGAGGTIVAQINEGYAQTLMCVYTVPANHTGLLMKGVATGSADKDMIIELYARAPGGTFRIQHIANLYQNNYQYEFSVPFAIPEKWDIDVRVRGYSNDSGAKVTAAFDMILYEEKTDY